MINLYAARENIDKERFIYEHVSGETIVIVPNQYTLVAEEQAMKYMGTRCLFNIEIMSMNRLGLRVLTEQGLESTRMLDRYGRFMLLNRIIKERKADLNIFANAAGKITFANMVSDFISDFKQQNCSMDEVRAMAESADADELLRSKLGELEGIVRDYEESIAGRYTDSEDYIARYVAAIGDSRFLQDKTIWIYGYDSITPKFINAMFELEARCRQVNFIVNRSDFGLDDALARRLIAEARDRDAEIKGWKIPDSYAFSKSETVERIERGLFNDELPEAERRENADFVPADLTIVRAANPYYEAESAACYIYHLIRDLGYRMKDIQVIANDEGMMQPIVRRTFEEYGLPIFVDSNRNITDTAPVNFIVDLLWLIRYGSVTDHLMALLKTGLADVDRESVEDLENYARIYHIKGSMWKKPFTYGRNDYGEKLDELETLRTRLAEAISKLEGIACGTVEDFTHSFRDYLENEWQLTDRIDDACSKQAEKGYAEDAMRSAESYKAALSLLDQIVEIMGDEPLDIAEFTDIYMTGLTNVEVGVIPPAMDGLSMGTMIRTRPGSVRAVVILGANEGTMPLQPAAEGLFSVDEKAYFKNRGFALGSLDDLKMDEEQVAMYRMLSKPSDCIYISYSMTDGDGKEAAASPIIDSLTDLFPRIEKDGMITKDVISAGWSTDMINSEAQSLRHLFNHLKDRKTGSSLDDLSQAMMSWHEHNNSREYEPMMQAVRDENDPRPLGAEIAGGIYAGRDGSFKLSASSISSYFDCPFKYYIDRGLRPQEEREFTGDSRSIGDVYHQCMMAVAGRIMDDRSYGEHLVNCSDEELLKIVGDELGSIAADYREGLFNSSDIESYRLDRITEICAAAVRAMAMQLTAASVTTARFEEGFGRGCSFKPVELEVNGAKFYVEGQIDRADILTGERVRIVDYKTGSDKLDVAKMSQGYKMQLMIYMMSAVQDGYEPAGMFYFNIYDPIRGYNDLDENKARTETAAYKLKGEFVNEEGVLESMPPEVLASAGKGLSREAFDKLKDDVYHRIEDIAAGIAEGDIGIHPFKDGRLVCGYCQYKAICKRDRNYVRNSAREIKKDKKKEDK